MTCPVIDPAANLLTYSLYPQAVVSNLRPMVVGPDYAVRRYSVSPSVNMVGEYDPALGTSAAWPNLGTNEVVDLTWAMVYIVNALVKFYGETGAPGITRGVQSGTTPNAIKHNAGATVFTGSGYTAALNVPLAVGDYVKLDNNAGSTLETKVAAFGYTTGVPNILILEDNLPAPLTGGANFNVTFAQIVPEIELPDSDVTLTSATVKANAAVVVATDRTGVTTYPVVKGDNFAGDPYSIVYASYRALRQTNVGTVNSIQTLTDMDSFFVGWSDPASGLGFAVARTLAPSSSPIVRFTAVEDLTLPSWQDVVNLIQRRSDWSSCAVIFNNQATTLAPFVAMVPYRESITLNSHLFMQLTLTTVRYITTGLGNTVTVDDSLTPGEDRTVTRAAGVTAPFQGAQAGDIASIDGVEYYIETVVSSQTVITTTEPSAGTFDLDYVLHPMTTAEQAQDYGSRASVYASREIYVTFPSDPEWNGEVVDSTYLNAVAAGFRGVTVPQQTLTRMLLESGWTGVPKASVDFAGYLEMLATYGVFIFDKPEDTTGVIVLYPNSTDQSEALNSREGIVANDDAIRRYIVDQLKCYVGVVKVTLSTLTALSNAASTALQYLLSATNVQDYGPIMVSGEVGRAYQDPNDLSKVILPITYVLNAGLEELEVEFTVTLATV